jgi:FKBP-type peptidyl-prolyl cis-trans isomerase SlyD
MEIGKNAMVTVTYDLKIDDHNGEMIEQTTVERPLQFLYGAGLMLPRFESRLAGLREGDPFEIKLTPTEAYGEVNEDAIVDLPKHIFIVDGKFDEEFIKVGNSIPMMSGNGQRLNGLVMEVGDNEIRMDFNHPLAGEHLYFTGTVIGVRQATDEEIVSTLSGGCGCSGDCSSGSCGPGGCGPEDEEGGCGSGCCC